MLLTEENDEEYFDSATVTRYRDCDQTHSFFEDKPLQPAIGENRIAIELSKSIEKQSDYSEVASGND